MKVNYLIYRLKQIYCQFTHQQYYLHNFEGWDIWNGNKYYCEKCRRGLNTHEKQPAK